MIYPTNANALIRWTWEEIEPFFHDLESRELTAGTIDTWLKDWGKLSEHLGEMYWRLYVATTTNTADEEASTRFQSFYDAIFPGAQNSEQKLKEKFLASGLEPQGYEMPLKNMRTEAALFREENLPVIAEEQKLNNEYDKLRGAQTVEWEGKEVSVVQLFSVLTDPDRSRREAAWRLMAERRHADRDAIYEQWARLVDLRAQMAKNAGKKNYIEYAWDQRLRFDYTPDDCRKFHDAIEKVIVPAAKRVYDRRREKLGVESIRPWDTSVDPLGREPVRPYQTIDQLQGGVLKIFNGVDPQLGKYFETMIAEGLLDLDNRPNKAPGAYCSNFDAIRRPFIFCNSVGLHEDVDTLLHEGGHAFHVFETSKLPHLFVKDSAIPMEFAEVASTAMEYLAMPYLSESGMYGTDEAKRVTQEKIESALVFWPYMAVVDAFQLWVYEHPLEAVDPARCEDAWSGLWDRFMIGIDYTGIDHIKRSRWQWQAHIVQVPFYYVEYGMSQLGAVQIWANAKKDQASAVKAYRKALSLGGSVSLPELYAAAGVRFAFDEDVLKMAVSLMEEVLEA